jgi:uncharacterized protein YodC (DUF2158 family)
MINIGDVVRLKSGGPKMTVNGIQESNEIEKRNLVHCVWFEEGIIRPEGRVFHPDALEKVEK